MRFKLFKPLYRMRQRKCRGEGGGGVGSGWRGEGGGGLQVSQDLFRFFHSTHFWFCLTRLLHRLKPFQGGGSPKAGGEAAGAGGGQWRGGERRRRPSGKLDSFGYCSVTSLIIFSLHPFLFSLHTFPVSVIPCFCFRDELVADGD